ncbi:MAG: hypothetical protein M3T96_04595 [Acidobacteriota bacterium]|nr:hypothetical protein [Acidobacteriota bacterium]
MELTISDEKTKELLAEVISEMLVKRRDVFQEIIVEALEEIGIGNAIVEGRKSDFVSEDRIFDILEGNGES